MKQPKQQPDGNPWQPPRGSRYSTRGDLALPYFLHWQGANGNRVAASYPTEAARETAAKALAEKRSDHGEDVLTFEPREWRQWLSFREMIGDADPVTVAHEWLARSVA